MSELARTGEGSNKPGFFNWKTDEGKKNVLGGLSIGLGVLAFKDDWRQKIKSVIGVYEEVHYVDPDATTTETTATV